MVKAVRSRVKKGKHKTAGHRQRQPRSPPISARPKAFADAKKGLPAAEQQVCEAPKRPKNELFPEITVNGDQDVRLWQEFVVAYFMAVAAEATIALWTAAAGLIVLGLHNSSGSFHYSTVLDHIEGPLRVLGRSCF